jgi:hypothetical protein
VFDYLHNAGIGLQQSAIVKNCMSNLKVNAEVEGVLDELNHPIADRLLRCTTLLRNIASYDKWDKYIRENQRAQVMRLYSNAARGKEVHETLANPERVPSGTDASRP